MDKKNVFGLPSLLSVRDDFKEPTPGAVTDALAKRGLRLVPENAVNIRAGRRQWEEQELARKSAAKASLEAPPVDDLLTRLLEDD